MWQSEWVRTDERLPELGVLVIVAVTSGRKKKASSSCGYLAPDGWHGHDDYLLIPPPRYWMSLPTAPEGA